MIIASVLVASKLTYGQVNHVTHASVTHMPSSDEWMITSFCHQPVMREHAGADGIACGV